MHAVVVYTHTLLGSLGSVTINSFKNRRPGEDIIRTARHHPPHRPVTVSMEEGKVGEANDDLLLRVVDRFIGHTQGELDAFMYSNAHYFSDNAGHFGEYSLDYKSECKGSADDMKVTQTLSTERKLSVEDKLFHNAVDSFLAMPAPSIGIQVEYELPAESKECAQERTFGADDGTPKDEVSEMGKKREFSIAQYGLYKQYCAIFEESIQAALTEDECFDSAQLSSLLRKGSLTKLGNIEDSSDDSLAAIFLEMVSALTSFEEFAYMMSEAANS